MKLAVYFAAIAAIGCATDGEPQPGDPDFERDPALDLDNRSAAGESRSHNPGQNCMHCHQALGPGLGRFTVGVTVYSGSGALEPDPILELYDGPVAMGGQLIARLDGDLLGNVFTSDSMPFPDMELFPVVKSRDGLRSNSMPFPTLSGACNLCHDPAKRVAVLPMP